MPRLFSSAEQKGLLWSGDVHVDVEVTCDCDQCDGRDGSRPSPVVAGSHSQQVAGLCCCRSVGEY
jgi:hypothetical protein